MKIKNLVLAGLFVIGMASCGSDDIIDGPNVGNPLDGYLSLTINSGTMNPATRTAAHNGTEAGVGDENKINSVTVVLTDESGVIKQVEDVTIASGTTTQKFPVSTGTYLVYALVNKPTALSMTVGGNINQELNGATVDDITKGFMNGSFFMTNEQSELDKTYLDAGVALTLNAGDEVVVPVKVDRLAAKVRNKTTDTSLSGQLNESSVEAIFNEVKVTGFVPMNLNPSVNIIQTWGKKNAEEAADLANSVLLTPVNPVGGYLLPSSTYKTMEDGVGVADLTVDADYVDSVYVSENRPTIKINSNGVVTAAEQGQTTAVIFRVVALKDNNPVGTFYAYNDIAYADLASLPSALGDLSGKTNADLRKMGIHVYENGVMYYTYFIKDPNPNYQLDGENYYGVFRNSIYNLNVKTISKLGDDVPDNGENPTNPVDPEDAKISVELTINDWVLNDIDIDF